KGFDAPAMFPSNGVMTWCPLLSTGSLGWFPHFNDTMGRSDSPPSVSTRSILHEPIPSCRPWFAPLGRGRPTGGQGVVDSGLPSGLTMETSGSLRFLGNPGGHCPCSSTPAGSGRLSGPRVSCLTRPPPVSTTKAPSVLYFRGSITRPLTSLSTLRRMGRPTTTQDLLLAAGPALPGGIHTRRVSAKGFRVQVSSS